MRLSILIVIIYLEKLFIEEIRSVIRTHDNRTLQHLQQRAYECRFFLIGHVEKFCHDVIPVARQIEIKNQPNAYQEYCEPARHAG